MSIKQDRCLPRTALDVDRRYNPVPNDVEELRGIIKDFEVDTTLSASSSNAISNRAVTTALNKKVSKVAGKDLSTNDFTDEYKQKIDNVNEFTNEEKTKLNNIEENAQVNVLEKIYIAGEELTATNKAVNIYVDSYMSDYSTNPVQNKAVKQYIDDNLSPATTYFASSYAESGVSILRSSIEVKNNRVCFNFVGTKSISANTTTRLFTFPEVLRPIETRDFVVFGQSSNTTGYVGYGYITPDGLLEVRFNDSISSYIRFTAVYDIY